MSRGYCFVFTIDVHSKSIKGRLKWFKEQEEKIV